MTNLYRFFREHLRANLPIIALGSLFMLLAGLCQGAMLFSLRFVFSNLGVKSSELLNQAASKATPMASNADFVSRAKDWLMNLLPDQSFLSREAYFVPALILVIFILKGVFTYSGTMLMVRSGLKATLGLRARLFGRILDQEPAFFQKHPVGELLTRCISDVGAVQGIASNQLALAVQEIMLAIGLFITAMYMFPVVTLAIFILVPAVVFPIKALSQRIRKINHRNMEASSRLLQRMKEAFSNIRVVIGFARENYEVDRFHGMNQELYRLGMKSARVSALSHPIMEILGGFLIGGLLVYATLGIQAGRIDGAKFFSYLIVVFNFYDPIRRLTKLNAEVQVAQASLDRVYTMLDRQPELQGPPQPTPMPLQPDTIRFEGVHFAYDEKHQVLRGIDLEVHRGETVALVGGSGGGKTTLVNLVPRFFDPTAGRLTLDGVDLREFDPRELRRRIGIVNQETLLFMDSIHDNIAYGKEASREAVVAAAKRAHAHDFIAALPKGYDTPLAETGSSVSGGQRQRLAIARALLQDPPILILDEATSALDTESERAVQAALEALMQDRTTLVIAHRLSTIQRATRICVLKQGRVAELGSHDELLALGGEYARLHRLQFAEA